MDKARARAQAIQVDLLLVESSAFPWNCQLQSWRNGLPTKSLCNCIYFWFLRKKIRIENHHETVLKPSFGEHLWEWLTLNLENRINQLWILNPKNWTV